MLAHYLSLPLIKTSLLFSLIIIVFSILAYLLAPLLIPIIISFALYAVLEPFSSMIERQGISRTTSSLLVLLLLVIVIALSVSLILPQLLSQLGQLQQQLPTMWETLVASFNRISVFFSQSLGFNLKDTVLQPLLDQANNWGKILIIELSNALVSISILTILVPIFTFFLIRDYRQIRNFFLDSLPNNSFELGWLIYSRVAKQLQHYIRGIMIQSAIMSLMTGFGFFIIGLDSYILLGLVAGILNLIPYVGPLLAMLLPLLLVLGQAPLDLWMAGAAISVILIAQLIDNVVVIPSVIANAVNLHPAMVIIGIIIFGNFWGFVGMVVAIPVLSTANIIFRGLFQGLQSRRLFKQLDSSI